MYFKEYIYYFVKYLKFFLGKIIPIGDQKDIGEFNLNFLARIEEGLLQQEAHIALMQIEEEKLPEGKFLSCSKSEKISLGSRINESDEKKKFIMTNDDHLVFKLFFGKIIRYMTYSEDGQQVNFKIQLLCLFLKKFMSIF